MNFFKKPIVKKIGILFIAAAVISGSFFFYTNLSKKKTQQTSATIDYRVRKGNIQSAISAIGTIYSSDARNITGTNGSTVDKVNVTEGQSVKSGDVLFNLKNEAAEIDLKKAKLNLSQLQSQLNTLKTQQSELTIYAPTGGIVKDVKVGVGDDVNKQTIVAVIEDTSVMKVTVLSSKAGQDSSAITSLKVNDKVQIYISEIDSIKEAVVTSVTGDSRGVGGTAVELTLLDKSGLSFGGFYTITFKFPSKDVPMSDVWQFNGNMVSVNAKQSGTVTAVYIKAGDTISKGKKIMESKNDTITNQIQSTQVNIESAQLDVNNKQQIVDNLTIKAPVDGVVFNIQVAPGDLVGTVSSTVKSSTNSSSQANNVLANIENRTSLQVRIPVDELDIGKVKVGQTCKITADAFKDKVYNGKVSTIAAKGVVQNGVATFEVVVDIENPEGLKTGMTTNVSIIADFKENVLLLPLEAIQDSRGRKTVMVKDGEKTVQREITVGLVNADSAEIVSGLKEGDVVVISSQYRGNNNRMNNMPNIPGMGTGGGQNRQLNIQQRQ